MEPEIGVGYRKVRKGEKIPANHEFWVWGSGPWQNCLERTGDTYGARDRLCRVPLNPKKPGTSHGKPTAKGMKEALKPKAKAAPNPVDTGTKAPEAPYRPTVGDVVKIVKDTCYHRFPIGSVFTIKKDDKSDLPYYPGAKKNPRGNWFKPIDCELITKAADVVKVPKESTPAKSVKPKYPAPRVQRELVAEAKPLEKRTKAELITTAEDLSAQFHNLAADHCIAGTKLDRALVDLKEAKAKIKELSKALEVAK